MAPSAIEKELLEKTEEKVAKIYSAKELLDTLDSAKIAIISMATTIEAYMKEFSDKYSLYSYHIRDRVYDIICEICKILEYVSKDVQNSQRFTLKLTTGMINLCAEWAEIKSYMEIDKQNIWRKDNKRLFYAKKYETVWQRFSKHTYEDEVKKVISFIGKTVAYLDKLENSIHGIEY
jgi:hypothetical protein